MNIEWVTTWTVLGVVWNCYRRKVVELWSQLIDKMYKIYSSVLCDVSCPVCCVTTVVNYLRALGSEFWGGWRRIQKSYFEQLNFKHFRRFNLLINNANIIIIVFSEVLHYLLQYLRVRCSCALTAKYGFGCKLSAKIFNSVYKEIRGDPQNMKRWEKLYSKTILDTLQRWNLAESLLEINQTPCEHSSAVVG